METVGHVAVTRESGVAGDCRGKGRPGASGRSQVSLIEAESWAAALVELGADVPWYERRANLLVTGLRLPREAGRVIGIGPDLRL